MMKSKESTNSGNDDIIKLIALLSRFIAAHASSGSDSCKKTNPNKNPNQSIMSNSGMSTMRNFTIETWSLASEGESVIGASWKSSCWRPKHNDRKTPCVAHKLEDYQECRELKM